MRRLQIFSQEIGTDCNLKHAHRHRCPIARDDRYSLLDTTTPMSDDVIIDNIRTVYNRGFKGLYAWHFYCEPLLYLDRLEGLHERIRSVDPGAKELLWTNGVLINNGVEAARLRYFHKINITRHVELDYDAICRQLPQAKVISGRLDRRLTPTAHHTIPCRRIFREVVVDYYGNWRLCCGDWQGTAVCLNAHTSGMGAIVDEYLRLRPLISASPQPTGLPEICYTCRVKG